MNKSEYVTFFMYHSALIVYNADAFGNVSNKIIKGQVAIYKLKLTFT